MTSTNPLPGLLPGKVFLTEPSPQWRQLYAHEHGRIAKRADIIKALES